MKIFISWSGEKSQKVAIFMRTWLKEVIQSLEPWMSKKDISAGARWSAAIAKELSESNFGIICLTRSNLDAPWILFEAGAIAKVVERSNVCPYLIGLEASEVPQGPLAEFQAKRAIKEETKELIVDINKSLGEDRLEDVVLDKTFERSWPDLEKRLKELEGIEEGKSSKRSQEQMIKETLEIVRGLARDRRTEEGVWKIRSVMADDGTYQHVVLNSCPDVTPRPDVIYKDSLEEELNDLKKIIRHHERERKGRGEKK